jgi:hypothetical protein
VARQSRLELRAGAGLAQPTQQGLLQPVQRFGAEQLVLAGVQQGAQVTQGPLRPRQLAVVGEGQGASKLPAAVVEDRRGVERGQLDLGRLRPPLDLARAAMGRREGSQHSDAGCDSGGARQRLAPVRDRRLGVGQGAAVELGELDAQLESVLRRRRQQRLERASALGVVTELALQAFESAEHLRIVRREGAGGFQHGGGPPRRRRLDLEQRGALEQQVAALRVIAGERKRRGEGAQQRLGATGGAVDLRDAQHDVEVVAAQGAQAFQPREGGVRTDALLGQRGGALEPAVALLGGGLPREIGVHLEALEVASLPLQEQGELLAQLAIGGERQRLADGVDRLIGAVEGPGEQACPLRQPQRAFVHGAGDLEAALEELESDAVPSGPLALLEGEGEGLAVAGGDLEDPTRVEQGVEGPIEGRGQEARQLETDRNLVGTGQVRKLRVEQAREGLREVETPIEVAQRGLYVAIVRTLGQRPPVGIGGVAQPVAHQERVAQPNQPVRGLARVLAAGGRIAAQLDQIEVVVRQLVTRRERFGDLRDGAGLSERDLERGDRTLQVVELPGPYLGDVDAQGGAMRLGLGGAGALGERIPALRAAIPVRGSRPPDGGRSRSVRSGIARPRRARG